jgi:hypothetical protein
VAQDDPSRVFLLADHLVSAALICSVGSGTNSVLVETLSYSVLNNVGCIRSHGVHEMLVGHD